MTDDGLSIGELAARSGIAASALRYYEAEGLLSSTRTSGNQRRFARAMLRRVAVIRAGQAAGIPLSKIKQQLDTLPPGRTPASRDWRTFSESWRESLDVRIRTLEGLRDRLTSCIGCGCLSLEECGLLNPEDRIGDLGPGARFLEDPEARDRARESAGSP